MTGVGRQLFVPLSLAVGFAMIASYLLSSSLVPVFAIMDHARAHSGEEEEGRFGKLRRWYGGTLIVCCWQSPPNHCRLLGVGIGHPVGVLHAALGNGDISGCERSRVATSASRLRSVRVLKKLNRKCSRRWTSSGRQRARSKVAITSDYMGVQPSSYPVNLIHLFTSGPEEAIVQVQLQPGHPNDEALRESLRSAFAKQMPDLKVSFEAGDIVSQVMSFGSPTPVKVDVQGVDLDQDYAYLGKIDAELRKLDFLRDISTAQSQRYPTADIDINRDYAGQFGLTMADVTNSLVPATGSSRFIAPNYWRDPRTGNAFQIQVQLPSNRVQGFGDLSTLPVMREGASQPQLDQIAKLQAGAMPETIERFSGQRVVSVTANLHGISLGDAQPKIEDALKKVGSPPQGIKVVVRGEIPASGADHIRSSHWTVTRHCGHLSVANGQLSVGPSASCRTVSCARRPGRCDVDAVAHGNDTQHPVVYGRHHGSWHLGSELYPSDHVR